MAGRVTEIPITTYLVRDLRKALTRVEKQFQVGSTPVARGKDILDGAQRAGMRSVALLLHNFEFVRRDRRDWFLGPFREHMGLTAGFRELCAYLAANPHRYRVKTFGELPEDYGSTDGNPGSCHVPKTRGIHLPL